MFKPLIGRYVPNIKISYILENNQWHSHFFIKYNYKEISIFFSATARKTALLELK